MELISEDFAFIRLVVGVLTSVFMLVLTLTLHPYLYVEDQMIAIASHTMLVVMFVGAGYIKAYEDTEYELDAIGERSLASKIYGFTSIDQVVGVLITFAFGMLVLLVATLAYLVFKAGRMSSIRLKETHKPPKLTLQSGQRFHLFNSHIWSTGQDAVATIKRQLQRLITSISIFLECA